MGFAIELRFPHRQYQATPWDTAVNSGQTEWPPSPWRLMRALLSVWHRMHPQMSPDLIDHALDALRPLPEIRLPDTRVGHTRHYLPKSTHRTQETGGTTLTLAPYRALRAGDPIVFWWRDTTLDAGQENILRTLLEGVGYFGRADSICAATLTGEVDDSGNWVRPDPNGPHRVLALAETGTRADLEVTVVSMKKAGLKQPPGSRWVRYTSPPEPDGPAPRRARAHPGPEAIRWTLTSRQPFPAEKGLLAANALRQSRVGELLDDPGAAVLHGHLPRDKNRKVLETTHHDHAHWLWLTGRRNGIPQLTDLVLWVPGGIPPEHLQTMLRGQRHVSQKAGETKGTRAHADTRPFEYQLPTLEYAPSGYVPAPFQLTQMGGRSQVLSDWGWDRKSRRWTSITPYLMTIYPKQNRPFEQEVEKDFARQWDRRGLGPNRPRLTISQEQFSHDGRGHLGLRRVVRHRPRKKTNSPRIPMWLTLEFPEPVTAPPPLGEMAHFGFGAFTALD